MAGAVEMSDMCLYDTSRFRRCDGVLKVDKAGRVRVSRERREQRLREFASSGISARRFVQLTGVNPAPFSSGSKPAGVARWRSRSECRKPGVVHGGGLSMCAGGALGRWGRGGGGQYAGRSSAGTVALRARFNRVYVNLFQGACVTDDERRRSGQRLQKLAASCISPERSYAYP
jgi:hypothetical protein